jgi:DNA-binding LacI/PurR family transcriptional regulator
VRREQRVTILDVAARAGVHAATVSRTINVPEKVAPETRLRVEAAVRELGFVPNRAARGLITGRTGNVAVIVPDITNPHFASLVRSVERSARQVDLQVLLVDTGEHAEEELKAVRSLSRDVDGFIVVSPRRLHRVQNALGSTPAVFVNRPVREHGSILLRTAPAVQEAVRLLADLGHTDLAYLGGPSGSWAAGERLTAVRRASRAGGLQLVELSALEPTFEASAAIVPQIVESDVSSVLAFNDQMALGVLAGLSDRGISVPEDISLVGFDDVPMAAMVAPPLTTIRLPIDEVGPTAVAMLSQGPSTKDFVGELVLRRSTARVKGHRANAVAGRGRPSSVADRG